MLVADVEAAFLGSVRLALDYCRPQCIAPLASSIPPLYTLPFRLSILRAEARITFLMSVRLNSGLEV